MQVDDQERDHILNFLGYSKCDHKDLCGEMHDF
jgi:hypothetical protein